MTRFGGRRKKSIAVAALRERGIALCVIDAPKWPTRGAVTADFVYVRFHGQTRLYGSSYDDAALRGSVEELMQALEIFRIPYIQIEFRLTIKRLFCAGSWPGGDVILRLWFAR